MTVIQWPIIVIAVLCFVAGWITHELQVRRRHKYRIGDHIYDQVLQAGATIVALGKPGVYVIKLDYKDTAGRDIPKLWEVREVNI